mmetsp:Transcript_10488/g.42797  ORF Transcript_10488/g.42797 Transcript_10488/m.42797 type:complete len:204 (-) Transcript_10488:154-765(-)
MFVVRPAEGYDQLAEHELHRQAGVDVHARQLAEDAPGDDHGRDDELGHNLRHAQACTHAPIHGGHRDAGLDRASHARRQAVPFGPIEEHRLQRHAQNSSVARAGSGEERGEQLVRVPGDRLVELPHDGAGPPNCGHEADDEQAEPGGNEEVELGVEHGKPHDEEDHCLVVVWHNAMKGPVAVYACDEDLHDAAEAIAEVAEDH